MRFLLLITFCLCFSGCIHHRQVLVCQNGRGSICDAEKELTRLLNEYRARQGLGILRHHEGAVAVARARTKQQFHLGEISHKGFPQQRSQLSLALGWGSLRFKAENVARFSLSTATDPNRVAQQFMRLWIDSRKHRQNIEGRYQAYGASLAWNGQRWIATALFL